MSIIIIVIARYRYASPCRGASVERCLSTWCAYLVGMHNDERHC